MKTFLKYVFVFCIGMIVGAYIASPANPNCNQMLLHGYNTEPKDIETCTNTLRKLI